MKGRAVLLGVIAVFALAACGSTGRTFGQAAEEWCHAHYPQPEAAEVRCFKVVLNHGPRFLELLEGGEQTKAEIEALREEHVGG